MTLENQTVVNHIEVTESGVVQVKTVTGTLNNGAMPLSVLPRNEMLLIRQTLQLPT